MSCSFSRCEKNSVLTIDRLNGSFFAAVYALAHFYQIWRSDHSAIRKFMFMVEFFYQAINMLFAWFAIVSALVYHSPPNVLLTTSFRATSSLSSVSLPPPSPIKASLAPRAPHPPSPSSPSCSNGST